MRARRLAGIGAWMEAGVLGGALLGALLACYYAIAALDTSGADVSELALTPLAAVFGFFIGAPVGVCIGFVTGVVVLLTHSLAKNETTTRVVAVVTPTLMSASFVWWGSGDDRDWVMIAIAGVVAFGAGLRAAPRLPPLRRTTA